MVCPFAASNADTPLLSLPLSYIRSGYFEWNTGNFNYRNSYAFIISSSPSASGTIIRYLYFNVGNLYPQDYNHKGYGLSLRCVAGSSLSNADTPLLSLPLSYIRIGNYNANADPANLAKFLRLWLGVADGTLNADYFNARADRLDAQDWGAKALGQPLRCVYPKDFAKDPQRGSRRLRPRMRCPRPLGGGLAGHRPEEGAFENPVPKSLRPQTSQKPTKKQRFA